MHSIFRTITLAFILLTAFTYAGVRQISGYSDNAVFFQFSHDEPTNTGDYHDGRNVSQNWLGAQTIKLTVGSEMDVWLSNYVASWYEPIAPLDGNIYDMGANKYGAYEANGGKEWTGNGDVAKVTFTDGAGHENETDAYFLGHFDGGEEVYLWLTTIPADGHEPVGMSQLVQDADHATTLVSRLDGTHDLAGNVRINFGIDSETYGYTGREWIAVGAYDDEQDGFQPSGQPLPSMMVSALLGGGVIMLMQNRRRKRA